MTPLLIVSHKQVMKMDVTYQWIYMQQILITCNSQDSNTERIGPTKKAYIYKSVQLYNTPYYLKW